jgi:hypothetical protein
MAPYYSEATCRKLEQQFHTLELNRPMRISRYDAGQMLTCNAQSIDGTQTVSLQFFIERFVGGGFAGQVYRVRLENMEGGTVSGLECGTCYALKIMIPPSGFALMFRNLVYAIGFQAPFQLQTNPAAARSGALWQKFIRRGAKIRFGDEECVNNIHVTFIDDQLGSCAELSDWVEGRTWKLEVDDHMDVLQRWKEKRPLNIALLGSPEYRAKKEFMHDFVSLLHDMGGHEFARQYEWSTCKSQPNCLKRIHAGAGPSEGLTAVDFRAGLALLPFLPMSPGDFGLIWNGLKRGSLVQFDRGDTHQLRRFIDSHPDEFSDMETHYTELVACEKEYRDSQPDITHNFTRLFFDQRLWSTMLSNACSGWRITGTIDNQGEKTLLSSTLLMLVMHACGCIPFFGTFVRKIFFHKAWHSHYSAMVNPGYFLKAMRGTMLERIINWHRAGRIDAEKAHMLARSPVRAFITFLLSFLPIGIYKFLTSWTFAREQLTYIFIRPVRLYFNAELREQWLRDMVSDGLKQNSLTREDADEILEQIHEPFIQKYLKSLAVHVCTLPVTQVVSVLVAIIYVIMNPELSTTQAWLHAGAIIGTFQIVPVSPGSLVRGFYVLYLVIRERNFKDYNIAVFLGFFKYIGYLAFPIQMAYRYPTLARFMAVHWATGAVPAVPVFGEQGALLEHTVFCTFYNWPLTIRRRIQSRMQRLAEIPARVWHIALLAVISALVLHATDMLCINTYGTLPAIGDVWWLIGLVAVLNGVFMSRWSGGMRISRRIICTACSGPVIGLLYSLLTALFYNNHITALELITLCTWRMFILSIFTTLGSMMNELFEPDPDIRQA